MGMHVSTVSQIVLRVSEAIARLYEQYISLPINADDRRRAQQAFFSVAAFPTVSGAIDCTHIKIQSPGGNDAEVFRNRKQYFSSNTQMICDSDLKIMNVVARRPGSSHDSTSFTHSNVKNSFQNNVSPDCLLLGDTECANNNYLLTPLLHSRTPTDQLYNESHNRTRNVIERCFGVLKRCFSILAYGFRLQIDRLLTIIVSASVSHNICLRMNGIVAPHVRGEINEEDLNQQIIQGQVHVAAIDDQEENNLGTQDLLLQEYFSRL